MVYKGCPCGPPCSIQATRLPPPISHRKAPFHHTVWQALHTSTPQKADNCKVGQHGPLEHCQNPCADEGRLTFRSLCLQAQCSKSNHCIFSSSRICSQRVYATHQNPAWVRKSPAGRKEVLQAAAVRRQGTLPLHHRCPVVHLLVADAVPLKRQTVIRRLGFQALNSRQLLHRALLPTYQLLHQRLRGPQAFHPRQRLHRALHLAHHLALRQRKSKGPQARTALHRHPLSPCPRRRRHRVPFIRLRQWRARTEPQPLNLYPCSRSTCPPCPRPPSHFPRSPRTTKNIRVKEGPGHLVRFEHGISILSNTNMLPHIGDLSRVMF